MRIDTVIKLKPGILANMKRQLLVNGSQESLLFFVVAIEESFGKTTNVFHSQEITLVSGVIAVCKGDITKTTDPVGFGG